MSTSKVTDDPGDGSHPKVPGLLTHPGLPMDDHTHSNIPPTDDSTPTLTAPDVEKSNQGAGALLISKHDIKRLNRKIDIRLVPILAALYLLCFLCRQNIANAKTYHMIEALNMSSADYQLALTVFFFTYSTFDVPANILLKKLRPSVWLPLITLLSGCVTIGMGFTKSAGALIATRLILGMTECGLFPGVAYVLTLWYCKTDTQFRQALFFGAASMAGAFAGLLAVGLSKMDGVGGLEGFRWIFIIEGLLTVVVAFAAFFIVLNTPATAKFLSAEEKASLLYRLEVDEFGANEGDEEKLTKEEQLKIHSRVPKKKLFKAVFTDWHVYAHVIIFYGVSVPLYSISLCLPSIVQGLGYTATKANFLTVPIYITACLLSLGVAFWADRKNTRFIPLIAAYCVMFIGFLIALVHPKDAPGVAYAGIFIAACGIYPAFPGMITWFSNNVASSGKRAIAMALHIGLGSFGGAMGPNFYRHQDAPVYRLGNGLNLMFVGLGILAQLAVFTSYKHINRKRERQCEALRAELEKELGAMKTHEERKHRKHRFHFEMEESLAHQGDRSVWFRYTV